MCNYYLDYLSPQTYSHNFSEIGSYTLYFLIKNSKGYLKCCIKIVNVTVVFHYCTEN